MQSVATIIPAVHSPPKTCDHAEAGHLYHIENTRALVEEERVTCRTPKTGEPYERRLPSVDRARSLFKWIAERTAGGWVRFNVYKVAATLECSTRTVWRALKLLERRGLVEWERGRYSYHPTNYKPFHRSFGRVAIMPIHVPRVYEGHREQLAIRRRAILACADTVAEGKVRGAWLDGREAGFHDGAAEVRRSLTLGQGARTTAGVRDLEAPRGSVRGPPHSQRCTCRDCCAERWHD